MNKLCYFPKQQWNPYPKPLSNSISNYTNLKHHQTTWIPHVHTWASPLFFITALLSPKESSIFQSTSTFPLQTPKDQRAHTSSSENSTIIAFPNAVARELIHIYHRTRDILEHEAGARSRFVLKRATNSPRQRCSSVHCTHICTPAPDLPLSFSRSEPSPTTTTTHTYCDVKVNGEPGREKVLEL